MDMDNNIYIVFSKTGTWLSKSIGFITKSDYTHVSLSLDNKFNNMYSFGRIHPNNPVYGGFTKENLYSGVYQRFSSCNVMIYKIPVTKEQLKILKSEIDKYENSAEKYKYNFLGLFAVLLDKPWKRKYHYFCSEFVTEILHNSNIWTSPKLPELTRPTDLTNITNKEILYKGLSRKLSDPLIDFAV